MAPKKRASSARSRTPAAKAKVATAKAKACPETPSPRVRVRSKSGAGGQGQLPQHSPGATSGAEPRTDAIVPHEEASLSSTATGDVTTTASTARQLRDPQALASLAAMSKLNSKPLVNLPVDPQGERFWKSLLKAPSSGSSTQALGRAATSFLFRSAGLST